MSALNDPRVTRIAALHEISGALSGRLVYLATPFTKLASRARNGCIDPPFRASTFDALAAEAARRQAAYWAANCAAVGISAASPIVMSCAMVEAHTALDPLDEAFWERWCAPLLAASWAVVVPPIHGALESRGVSHETLAALDRGRPVFVLGASSC